MTTFLKPHVSINVRNLDRSIAFYKKMFGIEPSKVRTGYAKFDVQTPALNFALNEVPSLEGPGALSHLGLQVSSSDDVACSARLAGRGPSPDSPSSIQGSRRTTPAVTP